MKYGELIDVLDHIASGLIGKKAEGKSVDKDDPVTGDLLRLVHKIRVSSPPKEVV